MKTPKTRKKKTALNPYSSNRISEQMSLPAISSLAKPLIFICMLLFLICVLSFLFACFLSRLVTFFLHCLHNFYFLFALFLFCLHVLFTCSMSLVGYCSYNLTTYKSHWVTQGHLESYPLPVEYVLLILPWELWACFDSTTLVVYFDVLQMKMSR